MEIGVESHSTISTNEVLLRKQDNLKIELSEERKEEFNDIIVKCIQQIVLIDTVKELIGKDSVYEAMPVDQILVIAECLHQSHLFARKFNARMDVRIALWRIGE